eukprot:SAG22_NODE_14438_length_374_cov_1.487273_1_plen_88_part_01
MTPSAVLAVPRGVVELLSLFMFYGIVLTNASSPRFEYVLCVVTAVSIAILSLVTGERALLQYFPVGLWVFVCLPRLPWHCAGHARKT